MSESSTFWNSQMVFGKCPLLPVMPVRTERSMPMLRGPRKCLRSATKCEALGLSAGKTRAVPSSQVVMGTASYTDGDTCSLGHSHGVTRML